MTPSEKMARRVALVQQLTEVDDELRTGFGMAPSNRAAAEARRVLNIRRGICADMHTVGYHPWAIPTDAQEARAI